MNTRNLIATTALVVGLTCLGFTQSMPTPPNDQAAPRTNGDHEGRRKPDVVGKITAINGQTITLKNPEGRDVTVTVTDATRMMKNRQPAKLTDFKVGDLTMVRGHSTGTDTWEAEFVGSREGGPSGFGQGGMPEALGKKFIAGEIKSIDGTHLTIARPDGQSQTITVDENTSFLKDRESITLADFKVGDHVFGPGEVKDGNFVPAKLMLGDPHWRGNEAGSDHPPN